MNTEIAKTDTETTSVALPTSSAPKGLANKLAGGNRYLRRIQLYSGRSAAVSAGSIGVNQWGSPGRRGQEIIALGENVDAYILAWRGKAIDFSDSDSIKQAYAFNDAQFESEEFQRIMKESSVKDSDCSYGVEFLIVVEKMGLVTYFANSQTARSEAEKLFAFLPQEGQGIGDLTPVTFGSENIVGKKHTWRGPTFKRSSTPFKSGIEAQELADQIGKFLNPPAQAEDANAEETTEEEAAAVSRER